MLRVEIGEVRMGDDLYEYQHREWFNRRLLVERHIAREMGVQQANVAGERT